jgi:hypothetical protein
MEYTQEHIEKMQELEFVRETARLHHEYRMREIEFKAQLEQKLNASKRRF